MSNVFLIADTHFGHANILTFLDENHCRFRPFSSVEDMDNTMVENWNKVVKPTDKVYHLGDVAMNKRNLATLDRVNGKKILIRGNHDREGIKEYVKYFKDVRGTHQLDNFILSHIPIHPDSVARWCNGNIHGHIHEKVLNDSRYFCVSVEQINYTPIPFEEVRKILYGRIQQ